MRRARLVLLHGFLGNPRSFGNVTDLLELDEPALCPALYGHGAPVACRPTYEFHDELKRLITLVEAYSGGFPVHIAGYSLGARLALAMLVHAGPGLFGSATLISGRRGLDGLSERQARLATDERWARRLRELPMREFLLEWEQQPVFASMQRWPPEMVERLRVERLAHDPSALADALMALSLANMPSFRQELSAVGVPVTLLAGEEDTKFVALGEELAASLPNAKFVVVDGAGHQLLIERPDAVAAAIRQGLDHAERNVEKSSDL